MAAQLCHLGQSLAEMNKKRNENAEAAKMKAWPRRELFGGDRKWRCDSQWRINGENIGGTGAAQNGEMLFRRKLKS